MKFSYWLGIVLICSSLSFFSGAVIPFFLVNNYVEPFLFLGFYLLKINSVSIRLAMRDVSQKLMFWILAIYTFLMFVLGIINTGHVINVYSDFRSNILFFFLIFFLISKKWEDNERERIFIHILWGIAIFDIMTMLLRPIILTSDIGLIKHNISTIVPAFLLIYYFRKGSSKLSILFFLIIGYEAVFSYMRNVYVISIIAILLLAILAINSLFKGTKSLRLNTYVALIFISFTLIKLSGVVYEYWMSDGARSIHSIDRSEELINGTAIESERINSFWLPILQPDKMIFPQGLGANLQVSRVAHLFNDQVLSTNDSSFLFLSYHYGFLFCWIFTTWFLLTQINILVNHIRRKEYLLFLIAFFFLSFISMIFFAQSIFFTVLPSVLAYSMILSIMIKPLKSWTR